MGDPRTIATRDILRTLLAEVDETDPELLPPPNQFQKGEKKLGVVTDDFIRRVFSLASFYRREGQRLEVDMMAAGEDPKKSVTHNQLRQKHETLQEIFWLLIRSNMDAWGIGIGIRKGWELVDTDDAEESNLPPILRKLFGQE